MTVEDISRNYEHYLNGCAVLMNENFELEPNPTPKSQRKRKEGDNILKLKEEVKNTFINVLKEYIQTIKGGCKDTFNKKDYKVCINRFLSLIFVSGKEEYDKMDNKDEFSLFMKSFMNYVSKTLMKTLSYDDVKEIIEKSIN